MPPRPPRYGPPSSSAVRLDDPVRHVLHDAARAAAKRQLGRSATARAARGPAASAIVGLLTHAVRRRSASQRASARAAATGPSRCSSPVGRASASASSSGSTPPGRRAGRGPARADHERGITRIGDRARMRRAPRRRRRPRLSRRGRAATARASRSGRAPRVEVVLDAVRDARRGASAGGVVAPLHRRRARLV